MNMRIQAISFSTLHDSRILLFVENVLVSISKYFNTMVHVMKPQSFIFLLTAASALLLSGCAKADAKTEDGKLAYRSRGIAQLTDGDYEGAIGSFASVLSCSNGLIEQADIDTSYYMAVAEFKSGDIERAYKTVDAIIALRPKDDGAYFMRGKINLALGNKAEAINDFDRSVSLAPENYDRYVGIYEELHAKGYDSEASGYLETALSAGGKLSDYNKGVLEYYMGSYTDARSDLELARKSQNSENLTLYLGKTYEALGDATYAMTIYTDYLRENSSAGRIYEQLAACKIKAGDYEGALETIEAGLSLGGGEGVGGMMFDRVVAYERLYDFDSAKKSMEEYLQMFPDDEVARRENVFLSSR